MTFSAVFLRLAPLALLFAWLAPASEAAALSRRDQAGVDAIHASMAAAEARYRAALVKIGNNDPDGQQESDAALEDMEDAVAACGRQRGCQVPTLLTTYKRLLKLAADGEAATGDDEDDFDPQDADPDHAGPGRSGSLAGDVPEAARAASLLDDRSHRFDAMVQYNPAVQAGIRRWLTDMRGQLLASYENYEYLRQLMWPSYERAGLPEALLFGIMAKESNGKVHATSRAGAAGPMQFMYATGKRFGLGVDGTGFDTRYDPRAAAEASAAYLNERMGELNRSIELALAAYNGGEGRALRVYQGSGGRGFWNADVYNQFPPETRDYVPMVIAAAWLFLHPKQYGLSFPRVDARPAPLRLQQPASIYELTICLGNRGTREGYMRALRNLNPRYQADSWLPAGTTLNATSRIVGLYGRYCVQGPRATLAQQLVRSDPGAAIVRMGAVEQLPDGGAAGPMTTAAATTSASGRPAPMQPRRYSVQRGETLTAIARKFQCSTGELARANDIKAPRYAIRPGQRLKLEGCRQ
ncbi:transglycosylase SLT domain-containing protein [Cognatiluteimonas weifangensis]|uniref:LysM peptidoglycan-binding domain-containing protein n=1 Tax=Cognatiluteimonas weifangensis TaxID=2303539 RepID=A0A372DJ54_9GAMM|nr:transglycosylase SLT domain-containing protein [Luteimonas weifangensis]RFP59514.1 LysM peptidoglycan-binding domain-containing protein [Luteimonas weifangensis]